MLNKAQNIIFSWTKNCCSDVEGQLLLTWGTWSAFDRRVGCCVCVFTFNKVYLNIYKWKKLLETYPKSQCYQIHKCPVLYLSLGKVKTFFIIYNLSNSKQHLWKRNVLKQVVLSLSSPQPSFLWLYMVQFMIFFFETTQNSLLNNVIFQNRILSIRRAYIKWYTFVWNESR